MNFLSEMNDRKESEEGRMLIQNKIVSSQKHRMKKEEGATAAASPTFSAVIQCGLVSQGQNGPRFSTEINFTGKPHKIPQMSYLRRENAGDF